MTGDEAAEFVRQRFAVHLGDVQAAKTYLLSLKNDDAIEIRPQADEWAERTTGAKPPTEIPLYEDDPTPHLVLFAQFHARRYALFVAAWELVREGFAFPEPAAGASLSLQWTTARPNRGGYSASSRVPGAIAWYPTRLLRPSWWADSMQRHDDFYQQTLSTLSLSESVKDSLRLALRCFQQGMYLPAVAMLGVASESAWIMCGSTLALRLDEGRKTTLLASLNDSRSGLPRKIEHVIKTYADAPLAAVRQSAGLSVGRLRAIAEWADAVRQARNVLHFGVRGVVPNDYGSTGVLLHNAVANLSDLQAVTDAAGQPVSQASP